MERTEIEEAYRRLAPIIRARCTRLLRDPVEAEDVAQDTFIRLWWAGVQTEDPRTLSAWIYRTSTRLAIDRLRRRKVARTEASQGDHEDTAPSAETRALARGELERLARTIPEKELIVVLLSRVDELTQPEIADVLNVSERTVRRLMSRFDERQSASPDSEGVHP